MNVFRLLVSVLIPVVFVLPAKAERLMSFQFSGQSEAADLSKARKEVLDKAIRQISLRSVRELIGEERLANNRKLIEDKVLTKQENFIPLTKVENASKTDKGTIVEVSLKLSMESLRKVLLRNGLLYEIKGPPRVLPLFFVSDRINAQVYAWWTTSTGDSTENGFLKEVSESLEGKLRASLFDQGFYAFQPSSSNFGLQTPNAFRGNQLRTEDYVFLGRFYNAAVIVRGSVVLEQLRSTGLSRARVKLEALQSSNGRVIGEVTREYPMGSATSAAEFMEKISEISEPLSKDLSQQVLDAWQKGTFGASLVKVTLNQHMNFKRLQKFREEFQRGMQSVKEVHERLYTPSSVVFELDTSSTPQELAKQLKGKLFPSHKVRVLRVSSEGLALSVQAR